MTKVIDATGCVLGRLATSAVETVLHEEEPLAIVNCEKAIVTGDREEVLARYRQKHTRGTQRRGPFFPRVPDRLVKRTVRGMLPYKKSRGQAAYDRLRCYIGVPEELADEDAVQPAEAQPKSVTSAVEVGEISRSLGAKV